MKLSSPIELKPLTAPGEDTWLAFEETTTFALRMVWNVCFGRTGLPKSRGAESSQRHFSRNGSDATLEGCPWALPPIVRYNSWQDFASNDMNNVTQSNKNQGGWFEFRAHSAFHTDPVMNRIAL